MELNPAITPPVSISNNKKLKQNNIAAINLIISLIKKETQILFKQQQSFKHKDR